MSIQLIHQYQAKVDQIIRYSGTRNESSLRGPFQEMISQYARARNLLLVTEVGIPGTRGCTVYPDGTVKDALRQDWGFWESKGHHNSSGGTRGSSRAIKAGRSC